MSDSLLASHTTTSLNAKSKGTRMPDSPRKLADRPFVRRCQIVGCLSLVGYILLSQYALNLAIGPVRFSLAGLSGVFFFAEIVACALIVYRKFDEFQRILLLRSFVWATVITVGLATVWGFADLSSHGKLPRFPLAMLIVVLLVITALTKVLIFRRNRSSAT